MALQRRKSLAGACVAAGIAAAAPARADNGACSQFDFEQQAASAPAISLDDRVIVDANSIDFDKQGLSQLRGAVKLTQGGREFTAEAIDYDDVHRQVSVHSESVFRNPQLVIKSKEASFDLNDRTGSFSGTEFSLPTRAARGTSSRIDVAAAGTATLKQTSYTTCGPDSDDWYIQASSIHLDHEAGLGTATNARLRFFDVPILYMPYLQFPIDDRRRSGFLFPTIGESSKTGLDLRWPFYLNLGPNYDAVLTPRLMSTRGLQTAATFRYLLPQSEGNATVEHIENDRATGDSRSRVDFYHHGLINQRMALEAAYAEVSDSRYFSDLGGTLNAATTTHLERVARLTYQAPAFYSVTAMVQGFQPIASELLEEDEDPYRRLPMIRLDALSRKTRFGTKTGLNAEYTNFVKQGAVQGQRMNLTPYLQYLYDETAWYVSSQADFNYTAYQLTDTPPGQVASPDRALPVLSAEGGLRFDRITHKGNIQTLEPRAFALYVPYENQDQLPLFDTGEPDFDFVQLFARNRFSGEDRIADAKQIAGAITSRLLDPNTGLERWTASFGQLYRVESPRVGIPDVETPERGATEFISELEYRLNREWSTAAAGQWSPNTSQFERANIALRYHDIDADRRLNVAYRYRSNVLEQTDVSFSTPVSGRWRLAGRSRYSVKEKQSLESLGGIEYETCCWAVRTSYRRFIASASGDYSSGIYLQLELKGLTKIGTGFQEMLPTGDIDTSVSY